MKATCALLDTPDLVDEIVESIPAFRYHPKFRRAVIEAKNLVMHYLDDYNRTSLGTHDRDLIGRIACSIHTARIERGY